MNSVFGRRANIDVDDDGVDAGAMWSRHYHNNVLLSHLTAANFHKNSHPNVSHYFRPTPPYNALFCCVQPEKRYSTLNNTITAGGSTTPIKHYLGTLKR